MENHLIGIFRFMICLLLLSAGLALMVRADRNDSDWLRRLAAVGAAVPIYFNEAAGRTLYLFVGSALEAAITGFGIGFVLMLGIFIMLLPLVWLVRLVIH